MKKTRLDIAHEESTRDPIFLFQRERLIVTNYERVNFCSDCEQLFDTDKDDYHDCESGNDVLSINDVVDLDCGEIVWETECVFLRREEAAHYGRIKHYNYPDGWRVYCVCAEGELAGFLNLYDRVMKEASAG